MTDVDVDWSSTDAWKNWAQYSPYTPLAVYSSPPDGCVVSQVNLIQRHGARFPTSGASTRIRAALEKLSNAANITDNRLKFLDGYQYDLGQDDLVPLGALQSRQSGSVDVSRYSHLFSHDEVPFVRASGSTRVIQTALNWTVGFNSHSPPPLSVILVEDGAAANNTLDDNMCTNAGSSDEQTSAWLAVYAPNITARLNAAAPGANLDDDNTFALMSLCPFESVAKEKKSPWCDVFDGADDWAGFEYSGDLDKYYGKGYGAYLGRVQGVGYVNELLARLTGTAVNDSTQTNSTLDSSAETFPLDRVMYADFSHDNQMIAIYAAMGLFSQPEVEPLSLGDPNASRTWRADRLVPFSSRMVVEKVACADGEFVRVLVNDEVQPLPFCSQEGEDVTLCELQAFVESQAYSRAGGEGDWRSVLNDDVVLSRKV
ncbi:acid phosphatase [Hymenopellis radicata]|nr:acid phosphatase [Hymenopellis radicata]